MFIFNSSVWNRLRCLFDKQLVVGCATGIFISQTFRGFEIKGSIPLNHVVVFVFAICIEKAFQTSGRDLFYIAILVPAVDFLLAYPLLADEKKVKGLESFVGILSIVIVTMNLESPRQISADEDCDRTYGDADYFVNGNNCDIEYDKFDYDTESDPSKSEDDTEDEDYVDDEDSEDVDFNYDDENDDEKNEKNEKAEKAEGKGVVEYAAKNENKE